MAETKEEQAKRRWLAIQEELDPGETEIERTLSNIAVVRAGWHRVRNEAGEYTYFPDVPKLHGAEQRAAEDRWQERSLAMHSAQTLILPEAKPSENPFGGKKIERGD